MSPIEQRDRTGSWLVNAWVSVVLIPIFMFVSFAAGYVVYDLLGYQDGRGSTIWADLVVIVVGLLITGIPCAAAVVLGRRAIAAGERGGWVPVTLGALAAVAYVLLTVISVIADRA
jgi:uncharacterized membrane protein YhaH (DUF805 family)